MTFFVSVTGTRLLYNNVRYTLLWPQWCRVYGVDIPAERKKTETNPIGSRKQACRKGAAPVFETFGPKTGREFEALLAERKGLLP
jgi:hypothetical protein